MKKTYQKCRALTKSGSRIAIEHISQAESQDNFETLLSTGLRGATQAIPFKLMVLSITSKQAESAYIEISRVLTNIVKLNKGKLEATLNTDSKKWINFDYGSSGRLPTGTKIIRIRLILSGVVQIADISIVMDASWTESLIKTVNQISECSHVAVCVDTSNNAVMADMDKRCNELLMLLDASLSISPEHNLSPEANQPARVRKHPSPVTFQNKMEIRPESSVQPSMFVAVTEQSPKEHSHTIVNESELESQKENSETEVKNTEFIKLLKPFSPIMRQSPTFNEKTPEHDYPKQVVKQFSSTVEKVLGTNDLKKADEQNRSGLTSFKDISYLDPVKKIWLEKGRKPLVSYCSPTISNTLLPSTLRSAKIKHFNYKTEESKLNEKKAKGLITMSVLNSNLITPDVMSQISSSAQMTVQKSPESNQQAAKYNELILSDLNTKQRLAKNKPSSQNSPIKEESKVSSNKQGYLTRGKYSQNFIQIVPKHPGSPDVKNNRIIQSQAGVSPASMSESIRLIKCLDDMKNKIDSRSSVKSGSSQREIRQLKLSLAAREAVCHELSRDNNEIRAQFESLQHQVDEIKKSQNRSIGRSLIFAPTKHIEEDTPFKIKGSIFEKNKKPVKQRQEISNIISNGYQSQESSKRSAVTSFRPFKKLSKKSKQCENSAKVHLQFQRAAPFSSPTKSKTPKFIDPASPPPYNYTQHPSRINTSHSKINSIIKPSIYNSDYLHKSAFTLCKQDYIRATCRVDRQATSSSRPHQLTHSDIDRPASQQLTAIDRQSTAIKHLSLVDYRNTDQQL